MENYIATRLTYNCAYLRSTKESLTILVGSWCQYGAEPVGPWWYWTSIGQYWLVLGGTESEWGSNGRYLEVLGQFKLVLLGIKWY